MNKEVYRLGDLQYVVSYPRGYVKGKQYPTIIFLHGAGTRGNDINPLIHNPYFKITENNVSVTLNRTRNKLKAYLTERGFEL